MTRREIQIVLIVSLIVALRLLGVFLILPVFSLYAVRYPGGTLPMVGLAFGIYALVQSLLQLPFGWASDRFGRKPLLMVGLFMFGAGSFACAFASNLTQLTFARAFQGTGAIASVAMASLGDITRPQVRTRAFTIAGIAVGSAFVLGLFGGSLLAARIGLSGLFYLLGILGGLAVLVTGLLFPSGTAKPLASGPSSGLVNLIRNLEVRKLCIAAFTLSFVLNLFLFRYPLDWADLGVKESELWQIYAVIFLPSLFLVFPYIRFAETRGDLRTPARAGWLFMTSGYFFYIAGGLRKLTLYVTGGAFFFGYSLFQPLLPSFLTQIIPAEQRGAAVGIYNLAGFLGASMGGILAGILSHFNRHLPAVAGVALLLVWTLVGFPSPPDSTS